MLARPDTERELRIRIETLEEENRQLREKFARLTGRNCLHTARMTFGFTDAEGKIFLMLLAGGLCEYDQLQDAIYDDGVLEEPGNPLRAVSTHIKRMRRKTRPFGIDFRTIYSLGFEMSEEARSAARKLMADNPMQERA